MLTSPEAFLLGLIKGTSSLFRRTIASFCTTICHFSESLQVGLIALGVIDFNFLSYQNYQLKNDIGEIYDLNDNYNNNNYDKKTDKNDSNNNSDKNDNSNKIKDEKKDEKKDIRMKNVLRTGQRGTFSATAGRPKGGMDGLRQGSERCSALILILSLVNFI